jgi:V/A-type H+-transporting ATPase subunit A
VDVVQSETRSKIIGKISRIAGPVVVAKGMTGAKMYEVVRVGIAELIGEIIRVEGDTATIQVYEETTGIEPGERVECTGMPLSVELGPGLISQIYDGIQRPLSLIQSKAGPFIPRGIHTVALDHDKRWHFIPRAKVGEDVIGGDILGEVPESPLVTQRILVPPGVEGKISELCPEGDYTLKDAIGKIRVSGEERPLFLWHSWPVRTPRPFKFKIPANVPLLTGQRIIDTFFPIAKGGTATIPGGFGTGKTIMQHQLAQWADANVIIYVGCGERGNEMSEVLEKFPQLKDPRSGHLLMTRTILVANVSNMPIAAREASVYTGITMAEYFRDMGYDVAVMADSTSRWAEALREISGRLEEMPGEEGYPAYLASRLAEFYERAGRVSVLGREDRVGSISVVGAVSPSGADFSEPVTQNTLRVVKVFWALDVALAQRRHFPAINWLTSYSLYLESLEGWFAQNVSPDWPTLRAEAMSILQRDEELREIVQLVGPDALSESQRALLEAARMIKEDFLMQHALHSVDSYCSMEKNYAMLKAILKFYQKMRAGVEQGIPLMKILELPVRESIARLKITPPEEFSSVYKTLDSNLDLQFSQLREGFVKGAGR